MSHLFHPYIIFLLYYWIVIPIFYYSAKIIYLDYKFGKIYNKILKRFLFFGIIYFGLLLLWTFMAEFVQLDLSLYFVKWNFHNNVLSYGYLALVLLNALFALAVGIAVWLIRLWAAGDAKYFFVLALLLPLEFYLKDYIPYFPSFVLLTNIIVTLFLWLVLKMLVCNPFVLIWKFLKDRELRKKYFSQHLDKIKNVKFKDIFASLVSFLTILILFQLLRLDLFLFSHYLDVYFYPVYFAVGFFVFGPIRRFFQKKKYWGITIFCIYLVFGSLFFKDWLFYEIFQVVGVQIFYLLFYYLIISYGKVLLGLIYNASEVKIVNIDELNAGDFVNKRYCHKILLKKEYQKFINKKVNLSDKEKEKLIKAVEDNYFVSRMAGYKNKFIKPPSLNSIREIIGDWDRLKEIINQEADIFKFIQSLGKRLTYQEAETLKSLFKEHNKYLEELSEAKIEQIVLEKPFSFAPFIFLGILITIVYGKIYFVEALNFLIEKFYFP